MTNDTTTPVPSVPTKIGALLDEYRERIAFATINASDADALNAQINARIAVEFAIWSALDALTAEHEASARDAERWRTIAPLLELEDQRINNDDHPYWVLTTYRLNMEPSSQNPADIVDDLLAARAATPSEGTPR